MADIDKFASSLLEEAKRFLEKAQEEQEEAAKSAYLHSALVLGFCSLEAHINSVIDDFKARPEFSGPHQQAVLLEKEVRLEDGEFKTKGLRMYPLQERILFLHKGVTGKSLDRTAPWWPELASATDLRNKLIHPKAAHEITEKGVTSALKAIIDAIDSVYRGIYGKGLPAAGLGLHSTLAF